MSLSSTTSSSSFNDTWNNNSFSGNNFNSTSETYLEPYKYSDDTKKTKIEDEDSASTIKSKSEEDNIIDMTGVFSKKLMDNDSLVISIKEKNNKEKELEMMKIKLDNALPIPSIVYMCITTGTFVFCLISYLLTAFRDITIIHPYYATGGMLSSLSLFLTAATGIKYWKENVLKDEEY
jgi:hypothetical protein